tara:strand:- start:405 stop:806 length:402 start_codon:yes stop_codon:yes gene_type:complete
MAVQLSVTSRNARLDAIETNIGTNPVLDFRTGSQPANCALANSGTQLGQITLPSDWLAVASSGSKAKLGIWTSTAIATGTAAHFRINSSDDTCHIQGSITAIGGGGDMELGTTSIITGQTVTVSTFILTDGNP